MLSADGKYHPTDAADAKALFRIIQSIPSKKAEPFKQWMAQVASKNITLYVPIGTGYAYRHHPEFCKFKEVKIERR